MFINVPSQQPAGQLTETAQNTAQITKDNKLDMHKTNSYQSNKRILKSLLHT